MSSKAAPPTVSQPASSMAIISLISGVLGLTMLPVIGSIAAVITGFIARREIRESAGALGGDGLATAGMVLGWIGIGLTVVGLCVVGVVFALPVCLGLLAIGSSSTTSWLPLLVALV
jgi:hypothetical protein